MMAQALESILKHLSHLSIYWMNNPKAFLTQVTREQKWYQNLSTTLLSSVLFIVDNHFLNHLQLIKSFIIV